MRCNQTNEPTTLLFILFIFLCAAWLSRVATQRKYAKNAASTATVAVFSRPFCHCYDNKLIQRNDNRTATMTATEKKPFKITTTK